MSTSLLRAVVYEQPECLLLTNFMDFLMHVDRISMELSPLLVHHRWSCLNCNASYSWRFVFNFENSEDPDEMPHYTKVSSLCQITGIDMKRVKGMRGSRGGGGRGQGVWTPGKLKKKYIEFLSNTGPDPLKNQKTTKQAFNVGPSSARQRNAISGGPMMARL